MDWSAPNFCASGQPRRWATCCAPASNCCASDRVTHSASRRRWRDANIKLDTVIDILGLSGQRILDKLIDGETLPKALATLAHRNIHATSEQLKATLRGRVEKHHCFLLRPHRDQIDVIYAAIQNSDEEVDNNVEPVRAAAGLLIDIPGLSQLSARVVLSEIGLDMSRFETVGHLFYWTGLCSRNDQSAGNRRSTGMKKGDPRLKNPPGAVRLESGAHQRELLSGPVLSPTFAAAIKEGDLRRGRLAARHGLSHAEKRNLLPESRRKPLRLASQDKTHPAASSSAWSSSASMPKSCPKRLDLQKFLPS